MNEQTKDWRNKGNLTVHRTQDFSVMFFVNKTYSALRNPLLAYKCFSHSFCFTSTSYRHFSRILLKICKHLFRKSQNPQNLSRINGRVFASEDPQSSRFVFAGPDSLVSSGYGNRKKRTKNICKGIHIWGFLLIKKRTIFWMFTVFSNTFLVFLLCPFFS